jgi:hypothetical protein
MNPHKRKKLAKIAAYKEKLKQQSMQPQQVVEEKVVEEKVVEEKVVEEKVEEITITPESPVVKKKKVVNEPV